MPKLYRAPLWISVFLLAFCSLHYQFRIFLPFARSYGNPGQATLGTDFYPRWSPVHGFVFEKIDPYSRAADQRNQVWYYGAALPSTSTMDPERFCYPGHAIPLFIPFGFLPFSLARVLMLILLVSCTIAMLAMWLRIMGAQGPLLVLGCLFGITTWPAIQALFLEQPTLLVAFFLAAAVFACRKERFVSAGCLLAFATIKPQIAWLCILWLILWSAHRRGGKRLTAGLIVTLVVLFGISEWLLPGWVTEWLASIHNYVQYTGSRLSLQIIFGDQVGLAMTGALAVISVVSLWRFRSVPAESEDFAYTGALVCALTVLLEPRGSWRTYEEVLLFPAAWYLLMRLRNFRRESAIAGILHLAALLAVLWPTIGTVMLTARHLRGASFSVESSLRAPTYGFFLVAPITVVALLLVRKSQHPPSLQVRATDAIHSVPVGVQS